MVLCVVKLFLKVTINITKHLKVKLMSDITLLYLLQSCVVIMMLLKRFFFYAAAFILH